MHIEIEVPRPLLTGALLVGVVSFIAWSAMDSSTLSADVTSVDIEPVVAEAVEPTEPQINMPLPQSLPSDVAQPTHVAPQAAPVMPMPMFYPYIMPPMYPMWGMPGMQQPMPESTSVPADTTDSEEVSAAEEKLRQARIEQDLLDQKEEVLRSQLKSLEEERRRLGENVSAEIEEQFRESTRALVALLQDEQESERFILDTLNQMRIAEGEAAYLGKGLHGDPGLIRLVYPLLENLGLTTMFHDENYPFAFDHTGVDLRAAQESTVVAAANGTVHKVSVSNGKGYNWIMIDHGNGLATLYGHVTETLVVEGQPVKAGQEIARSGGMPGTPGAGSFTTGPHLHFEVWLNGVAVDPEDYLPRTSHVQPW